ncbi:BAR-domain-containing protein [Coemansia reversa NRRL 1564]|uniref:BAR-domain-containing protein n=1 Tax=Coemansia reversa (strain ATCC 12441 / NRRL 1564) TaxID=763665 RepID=A0A2G5BBT1_COERN|nr:BAR-domain-containing protein [Coemansia reversa NRRL 1564]|eukprot:PIA16466.1 BAR-domain-containing protein [Coemansia reversa NRRL 1564]
MSWKGFKKALERMPHQLQSKIGRGTRTVDSEFDEFKQKFIEMETSTKNLFQQTAQFRDGIRGMLVYQSAYFEQVLAIYRPISTDPEGSTQPVGSYTDEGASPELLRVAEEFRNRVSTIREKIEGQLARLDVSVVAPVQDLMNLMRNIHKVIQKRDHKLVDYDRYKAAVEKAEAKESSEGQRRLGEERAYQKHGAQYQEASRQYNYFNDMLKAELKQMLDLRQAFIDPIFLKFFRIQHELYTSMFTEFKEAARSCPALDLNTPVLAGWQPKWSRAEQNLNAIDLWGTGSMNVMPYEFDSANKSMFDSVKGTFRKKDKAPQPVTASSTFTSTHSGAGGSNLPPATDSDSSPYGSLGSAAARTGSYGAGVATAAANAQPPATGNSSYGTYPSSYSQAPPPKQQGFSQLGSSSHAATDAAPPAYNSVPLAAQYQPPAEKGPSMGAGSSTASPYPGPSVKQVRALYDFSSTEKGDLNFREGQIIKLIKRTPDVDDWWTGEIDGHVGVFPGNYVEEL